MKTIYSLLIFVFAVCTHAQIVTIPDANFKARLVAAAATNEIAKDAGGNYFKIDANNDSQIQESEALQVSWLDVKNAAISNLTGILSFANLVFLDCSENQLAAIDVSSLHGLESFNCSTNQLTALQFTGLDSLEELSCAYNQIPVLDFSTLNLKILQCHNNLLTSLNVSSMTNLMLLFCDSNQLSLLNMSGLVNMIEVSATDNLLTNIDFNGLTALEEIAVDINPLTSVDISGLPNVAILNCNGNPNLTEIICKNGHNEFIAFHSNPNLAYICADAVQISGLQSQAVTYGYTNLTVNASCLLSNADFGNAPYLTIYPNPAKNILHIQTQGAEIVKSTALYNALGQRILFLEDPENATKIDISGLQTGMYFITTQTDQGTRKNRFVKE